MSQLVNADFTGMVMFAKNHRENDLLVKFLTREYGKRMFFIKNAKKKDFKLRWQFCRLPTVVIRG